MRQIFLDIETTGREFTEGHRIVEIAAIEMVDSRLSGRMYHQYVNPDRTIGKGAHRARGISAKFLSTQPRFNEIAETFLEFVRGAQLLIHDAPSDTGFIEAELRRTKFLALRQTCEGVLDTLTLARQMYPRQNNSLEALCARHGVDLSASTHEGALRNAITLADIYLSGFASLQIDIPKAVTADAVIWIPDIENELLSHLRRNPKAMFDLTPRRFEELVAAIFRNNGFSVDLTPETRDGGVDIIAVQRSALTGDLIHLVECKRYRPDRRVGIGVVQRLLGTVTQRRATKGIIVATSSFSRDAVRVAQETRHVIALNDYNAIVGWLRNHDPSA